MMKTSLGPKGGRLPPGLLSPASSPTRHRIRHRQLYSFLFVTAILGFIIYSSFYRPGILERLEDYGEVTRNVPGIPGIRGWASPNDASRPSIRSSRFDSRKTVKTTDSQRPLSDGTKKKEPSTEPKLESTKKQAPDHQRLKPESKEEKTQQTEKPRTDYRKPKSEPDSKKEKPHTTHWPERPNLQHDLDAFLALLPDELTMRELLRPIDIGGPGRMRELGLRTRAYQKYFSAWEKLHLGENEETGETYIRDDVVQYLHGTQDDTSKVSPLSNTIRSYEFFRAFLAKLSRLLFPFTSPYFADHMTLHAQFKNAGRGIVLTAGDDQAQYLLTTIYTFRELGCDLPIEVMYLGDSDLGEDHRFELEALPGVTTRDISQMVDDEGWKLAGWAIKPFAMLMSSFREVIFIDADSLFFKNPAILFDHPEYVETGALFFRDRSIMPESKRRWLLQVLPRPIPKAAKESTWWTGVSGHYQESGVVVVDKWRHLVSMLLVCRFNGSDRDGRDGKIGVYEMMHGDKETFWIGFLLAGDPSFAFHKGEVGVMGSIRPPILNKTAKSTSDLDADVDPDSDSPTKTPPPPDTNTICGSQLLHLDIDGTPLWFNGWLLVNKFAERAKREFAPMTSFMMEPRKPLSPDFWDLTTDNMCCLTSDADATFEFDAHDAALLAMMRDRATEIGAGT